MLGLHVLDFFVQHIPQMFDWIEIWGIWRPTSWINCCVSQTIPESFFLCGRLHYLAERCHWYQGIQFPWKGWTWSATILRKAVDVKVTSTWMAGPKAFQKNISQSITLPLPSYLFPIVHPGAMCSSGKQRTLTRPSMWCKRTCDSPDQTTFFNCSVVQFWCSHAHCRCFRKWTGVSISILTGLRLRSPIRNKLQCTVCSETILSEPALTFSAIWATVAHLLDQTTQAKPPLPPCINEPWPHIILSAVHRYSYLDSVSDEAENWAFWQGLVSAEP